MKEYSDQSVTPPRSVREVVRVQMPTEYGTFELVAFEQPAGKTLFALIKGEWTKEEPVLGRVHSSCITGDILGSMRCDCGPQLQAAMQRVQKEGKGFILYVEQEGRGIGFLNKMKAYQLQEQGFDTVEANLHLGFAADQRDYTAAAAALEHLQVGELHLLSNNPQKAASLKALGVNITKTIALEISPNEHNRFYLQTKRDKMGHILFDAHLK
jgi:3,4-dihydroxy 2-butanone 4-phosphate synthase/GTP cyclohydrolase II